MRTAIIMTQQRSDIDPPSFYLTIYDRGTPLRLRAFDELQEATHYAYDHDVERKRVHLFSVSGLYVPIDDIPGG